MEKMCFVWSLCIGLETLLFQKHAPKPIRISDTVNGLLTNTIVSSTSSF